MTFEPVNSILIAKFDEKYKMDLTLRKEFDFYIKSQEKLLKKYQGKFLVIKDEAVQGSFSSQIEACRFGKDKFELGTFLIQLCTPGETDYTQTFHSRVSFTG